MKIAKGINITFSLAKLSFMVLLWCNTFTLWGQNIFNLPEIISLDKENEKINPRKILQDSSLFLWIATAKGLYRYDGLEFVTFPNLTEGDHYFKNDIRDIYLEDSKTLWVATAAGLFTFDLASYQFKAFKHPDFKYKNPIITRIKPRGDSLLLFAVEKEGLFIYHKKKNSLEQIKFTSKNSTAYVGKNKNHIFVIHFDIQNDSIVWIGSLDGLIQLNIFTYSTKFFLNNLSKKEFTKSNIIRDIYQADAKKILLATWGGGLNIFYPKTQKFKAFPTHRKETLDRLNIHGLMPLGNKKVYCLTNEFNFVFDYEKELIIKNITLPFEIKAQKSRYFKDKHERYWGNFSSYLGKINPLAHQFKTYILQEKKHRENQFYTILELENPHELLVTGDLSDGAFILNRQTHKVKKVPISTKFRSPKGLLRSWATIKTPQDEWIILDYDSLFTFSSDGKYLLPYKIQLPLANAQYRSMLLDSRGSVWVGSYLKGLVRFSPKTGEIKVFYHELFPKNSLPSTTGIFALFEDSQGNIWIRRSRGFSVYDAKKDTIHNFTFDNNPENSFIHVSSFVEDKKGKIWMGGGNGFGWADVHFPAKGVIKKIDFPEFKGHVPSCLTTDDSGKVWFLINNIIYVLNPLNLQFKKVDDYYGYSKENKFSLSKLSTGEIAIGFRNTIKIFHPDSLQFNTEIPKPYVKGLSVNAKWINDSLFLQKNKIDFQHFENALSFQISAIAFTHSQAVRFSVKLKGADKNWLPLSLGQRTVSYFHLSPGTYIFQVKAANNEGVWSKPYRLQIKIASPWWKTIWFYLALFLSIGMVFFLIFRSQFNRRIMKQNTQQLREKNEFKNKLITNITHEFRTPLTIIEGMADEIEARPSLHLQKKVGLIKKNTNRLLQLVNQMLELAKLESKSYTVDWIQDDIVPFLTYMVDAFSSLAVDKNISLQFYAETPVLVMDFDLEKLKKILTNLLSNAIKFTPEYGRILVVAKQIDSTLQIKIIDSGKGIPKAQLGQIFTRFYRVDESGNREGSGIGLAIVRELIKLLNGQVYVESKQGKGSTFFVEIPINNHAPNRKATLLQDNEPITRSIIKDTYHLESTISSFLKKENKPIALIVEDNAGLIYYLKNCLYPTYSILISRNGKEGIKSAFDTIPDIIISDVMMPLKDGFELCKTLKEDIRTSHIPIILLTAKADEASKLKGIESGADAYLNKPFSKEELLLRLSKLMESREKLKRKYASIASIGNQQNFAPSKEEEFTLQLNKVIKENLKETDFSIVQLCKKMAISRPQLYRKIKSLTGFSTSIYLRKYRMNHARLLLETTDKAIAEIALDCGIESPSWFAQAFKEEFGIAPSETRK